MIRLVILALAAWRLASLLVDEKGPGDAFLRLRHQIGFEYDANGYKYRVPVGFLGGVFDCVWCMSIWTAAVLGFVYHWRIGRALTWVLAVSAAAIIVHERVLPSIDSDREET